MTFDFGLGRLSIQKEVEVKNVKGSLAAKELLTPINVQYVFSNPKLFYYFYRTYEVTKVGCFNMYFVVIDVSGLFLSNRHGQLFPACTKFGSGRKNKGIE